MRSRGLGDVYKRQVVGDVVPVVAERRRVDGLQPQAIDAELLEMVEARREACLLYTSDAADERSSVDLGGRRIIQKKTKKKRRRREKKKKSTTPRPA